MIRLRTHVWILFLVGSISFGCRGTDSDNQRTPNARKTHNDRNLAIAFDYPAEWTVTELEGMKQILIESPASDEGWQAVVVIALRMEDVHKSAEESIRESVQNLSRSEKEFRLLNQKVMFLDHWSESAMAESSRDYHGVKVRDRHIHVSQGAHRVLSVAASAPSDVWDRWESGLALIVTSLRATANER